MLNKERSKKINFTKSLIVLPILALFLMAFNTETIYQVSEATIQQSNDIELVIEKDTQNETLAIIKEVLIDKKIDFSYTVVRNETGEIIDLELDMKDISDNDTSNYNASYKSTSAGPISSVAIKLNPTAKSVTIEEGNATKSTNEAYTATSAVTEIKIEMDKDSREEIDTKNQKFLKEKGVDITFKEVKRNKKNEITAIKVFYDNGAGQKGSYERKSNRPIIPFEIKITFKDKEGAAIRILEKSPWVIESVTYSVQVDSSSNTNPISLLSPSDTTVQNLKTEQKGNSKTIQIDRKNLPADVLKLTGELEEKLIKAIELYNHTDSLPGKASLNEMNITYTKGNVENTIRINTTEENETEFRISKQKDDVEKTAVLSLDDTNLVMVKGNQIRIKQSGKKGKNPLIIIDGVKMPYHALEELEPNDIYSMSVLKGKASIESYGKEGKHGVILITTKKDIIAVGGKAEITSIRYSEKGEKPLIIIDGKKVPDTQMKDLDPNNIFSMSVLKAKAAIESYGKEGKHGVILITTKKE